MPGSEVSGLALNSLPLYTHFILLLNTSHSISHTCGGDKWWSRVRLWLLYCAIADNKRGTKQTVKQWDYTAPSRQILCRATRRARSDAICVGSNCPGNTKQERGPAHTGLDKALKSRDSSGGSYQEQEHMKGEGEEKIKNESEDWGKGVG